MLHIEFHSISFSFIFSLEQNLISSDEIPESFKLGVVCLDVISSSFIFRVHLRFIRHYFHEPKALRPLKTLAAMNDQFLKIINAWIYVIIYRKLVLLTFHDKIDIYNTAKALSAILCLFFRSNNMPKDLIKYVQHISKYTEKILYEKLLYIAVIVDHETQIENFYYISHVKNIIKIFIIPSWFATVVHSNF